MLARVRVQQGEYDQVRELANDIIKNLLRHHFLPILLVDRSNSLTKG